MIGGKQVRRDMKHGIDGERQMMEYKQRRKGERAGGSSPSVSEVTNEFGNGEIGRRMARDIWREPSESREKTFGETDATRHTRRKGKRRQV